MKIGWSKRERIKLEKKEMGEKKNEDEERKPVVLLPLSLTTQELLVIFLTAQSPF